MKAQFDAASGPANAGMALAGGALTRSGIEWLRGAMDGSLPAPPFVVAMGIRLVQVEEGLVVGTYEPDPNHLNGLDTLHGGVLATIADTAASCAVLSVAPAGVITPTLELKINFLRPATTSSGTLRAEGRLISAGRTTALAEARIRDAQGRQIAHATVTCSLISLGAEDPS